MKIVAVKHCRRFGTVDLAFTTKKENDYFCMSVWAVTPKQDLLLIDVIRERLEGPDIEKVIIRTYHQHKLAYVGIEDTQAQLVVIQALRKKGLTVRALKADKDKLSRAIPATVRMEAGQIFIPEHAEWLDDWIDELINFPKGAHDDQVDCLSYAAVEVQRFGGAAEPESYEPLREYAEKDIAAELWNRLDNPMLWVTDGDDE